MCLACFTLLCLYRNNWNWDLWGESGKGGGGGRLMGGQKEQHARYHELQGSQENKVKILVLPYYGYSKRLIFCTARGSCSVSLVVSFSLNVTCLKHHWPNSTGFPQALSCHWLSAEGFKVNFWLLAPGSQHPQAL